MRPVPKEDCTKEEAIEYLSAHIDDLNKELVEVKKDEAKQTRAWAMDRAVRVYEKHSAPEFETLKAMADNIYAYAVGE